MRIFKIAFAFSVAACVSLAFAQVKDDQPVEPFTELQSEALTPGLVLEESPRPIHQIRLILDASLTRGSLILDGNLPVFNEFGELVGGIDTPQIRDQDKGSKKLVREIGCTIEELKAGPDRWRLYRIHAPTIRTPIRIAARDSLADGGPVRLIVLGSDSKAKAVIACTRYGLVVP